MTNETSTPAPAGITRRSLIGGIGVAAGAASLGGRAALSAPAKVASSVPQGADPPLPLDEPLTPGLVYLPLDAFAFDVADSDSAPPRRIYERSTGMRPSSGFAYLYASLPIPADSIVKELRFSYVGSPAVGLSGRVMGSSLLVWHFVPEILPRGFGVQAHKLNRPGFDGGSDSTERWGYVFWSKVSG
jgi:hypothetical protein